jgi:hypothetical protein
MLIAELSGLLPSALQESMNVCIIVENCGILGIIFGEFFLTLRCRSFLHLARVFSDWRLSLHSWDEVPNLLEHFELRRVMMGIGIRTNLELNFGDPC